MPIQNSARCSRRSLRQTGKKLTDSLRAPKDCHSTLCCFRVTIISQQLSASSQPLLERDQTFIVQIGTTEIDSLHTCCLTLLDKPPEQKRHSAEAVKPFVGAPVFVDQRRSMPQREHRRDWNAVLPGNPDLKLVWGARKQISEPGSRLR